MDDIEYSVLIDGFPRYKVTSWGRVFNTRSSREMVLSPTQFNELTVGLVHDGHQYRRSVKVLVARAFVEGETRVFNTPILLDGDRTNLRADNIQWRPRWFAYKYVQQFENVDHWIYEYPVVENIQNVVYRNIYEAAVAHGHLFTDVFDSIQTGGRVFPDHAQYDYI